VLFRRQAAAGFRPATFKELLAFGQAYPEVQRTLPAIALGSSADLLVTIQCFRGGSMMPFTETVQKMETVYPFLGGGLAGRTLNADWLDDPKGYATYYACFVRPE
jgi:hypothetical protein